MLILIPPPSPTRRHTQFLNILQTSWLPSWADNSHLLKCHPDKCWKTFLTSNNATRVACRQQPPVFGLHLCSYHLLPFHKPPVCLVWPQHADARSWRLWWILDPIVHSRIRNGNTSNTHARVRARTHTHATSPLQQVTQGDSLPSCAPELSCDWLGEQMNRTSQPSFFPLTVCVCWRASIFGDKWSSPQQPPPPTPQWGLGAEWVI